MLGAMRTYQVCIILLAACTIPISSEANENEWSVTGPAGGSVKCIEIHPQNWQIIYIGTIQNGIYKTTDAGGIWHHVETPDQLVCMRRIAIHPDAPDTIYATSTAGIFKSPDSGIHWTKLYPPQGPDNEYEAFLVHPDDPTLLFAGGPLNEWMSTNSGQSWSQINVPHLVGVADLAVDPSNTHVIYMVTNTAFYGHVIYKSTDRGQSWSDIQNNISGVLFGESIAIDPQNTEILYLGLSNPDGLDNCLFKSTNGGQLWSDISPPNLTEFTVTKVIISPLGNNTIYVSTRNDGFFGSTDGGTSWTKMINGLKVIKLPTMEIDATGNTIYLGTYYDGIYRSTDGGGSWQKISDNVNLAPSLGIAVFPDDPSRAYLAAANGLFRTENLGSSWEYVETDAPLYHIIGDVDIDALIASDVYIISGHRHWVPYLETGFYSSTDNGATWFFFNDGLPGDISYREIVISYLGPESWRIFLRAFPDIYFSDDMAQHWNICASGLPPDNRFTAIEVSPSNQSVIIAGDSYNRVYRSQDRGDNWNQLVNLPVMGDYGINDIAIHPNNPDQIYVASGDAGLFVSTDGGQSWVDSNNDLPLDPDFPVVSGIAINPYNPSNMFVCSFHYGIYQTHNGGQSWEPFNDGLDTTTSGGYIEFAAGDTNQIYFASADRSVWTITRVATAIDDDSNPLPSYTRLGIFPNPFNSSTSISFTLGEPGLVSLSVYNIRGQRITELFRGIRQAGEHSISWDASGYPSGVYFARLEAGGSSQTAKMVLLK
jgi:photosystem II stability/assembly factor-like uncharacterized protein